VLGSELKNASVYTDFQGLSNLRREAGQNSEQALEKTARQFEALFVQMMLKSMREAGQGEGLMDSDQSNLYRDMYDKQLSLHLTEQGEGMGIAKMMIQQLKSTLPAQPQPEKSNVEGEFAVPQRGFNHFELQPRPSIEKLSAAEPLTFDSPEQFVTALSPHAERAAERLGVDPKALLAQAALETGWGKAVIRHPDGSSSHNLFNIKADGGWEGNRVAKQTLEYRQGVAVREMAQFRSYGSLAESFDDYTQFISNSPRYADALKQGTEAGRYVEALQEAGYATDPAYATKIKHIMNGPTLAVVGELKKSEQGTLS
jgi:flagellar protein FlgJ